MLHVAAGGHHASVGVADNKAPLVAGPRPSTTSSRLHPLLDPACTRPFFEWKVISSCINSSRSLRRRGLVLEDRVGHAVAATSGRRRADVASQAPRQRRRCLCDGTRCIAPNRRRSRQRVADRGGFADPADVCRSRLERCASAGTPQGRPDVVARIPVCTGQGTCVVLRAAHDPD